MYKVFEMSQSSNIDDPADIIEVQQKVRDFLEANRFQQDEIKKDIASKGPLAIPGLINSLYVYMHLLKNDQNAQTKMTEMIIDQAGTNEAARELLFRTGVLESPFAVPRAVALNALEKLNWKPNIEQLSLVKSLIEEARRLEDQEKVLDLCHLLALGQNEKDLILLLEICKRLIREKGEFGRLLALIVRCYPYRAEKIVAEIMLEADEQYSKDRNIAEYISKALGPVSKDQKWLDSDCMLNLSITVLVNKKTPSKGNKSLEHLWSEVLRSSIPNDTTKQMSFLTTYGQRIREKCENPKYEIIRETMYRYWFEAVGRADGSKYIITEALEPDDSWCIFAILQLFFMKDRNREAAGALEQVRLEKPQSWQDAENLYNQIKDKKSNSTWEMTEGSEGAGISSK